MITKDQLKKIATNASSAKIDLYYDAVVKAMTEFGIDTDQRQVMFLSQILTESGEFATVVENLNYSVQGLLKTFGKYFNATTAEQYAHHPDKIANRVYANRMGNGNEASGDGYKYRGRGLIQTTGKDAYVSAGNKFGVDLTKNPDYLTTPEGAARSAAFYWQKNNLNRFADRGDIVGCSKAVNGGTNGLEERKAYYAKGLKAIGSNASATHAFETVSLGDEGDTVKEVQKLLGVVADGQFGPGTKNAVIAFQKAHNLTVDGVVGPATYSALKGK